MATSIHLTRRTAATTLTTLQDDTDLWDLGQELLTLFDSIAMPLITGTDVYDALIARHPGSTIAEDAYKYEWAFDPEIGDWVIKCTKIETITVPDPQSTEPMIVRVHQTATYGA